MAGYVLNQSTKDSLLQLIRDKRGDLWDDGGKARQNNIQFLRIGTFIDPLYNATIVRYNSAIDAWEDYAAVVALPANGETLTTDIQLAYGFGNVLIPEGSGQVQRQLFVLSPGITGATGIPGVTNIGINSAGTDVNLSTSPPLWLSTEFYQAGAAVTHSSVVYRALSVSLNQTPPNATYWTPLSLTCINIPSASTASRGLITFGNQTLGGKKTFENLGGFSDANVEFKNTAGIGGSIYSWANFSGFNMTDGNATGGLNKLSTETYLVNQGTLSGNLFGVKASLFYGSGSTFRMSTNDSIAGVPIKPTFSLQMTSTTFIGQWGTEGGTGSAISGGLITTLGTGLSSTTSAPSNTTTPAAWANMIVNGTTYKTPLYL